MMENILASPAWLPSWDSPLNCSLLAWWLAVPGHTGFSSPRWLDIGSYRFDGDLASPVNTVWTCQSRPGGKGALHFTGASGAYVTLDSRIFSRLDQWTVTAWIRRLNNSDRRSPFFGDISGQSFPAIRYAAGSNTYQFYAGSDSGFFVNGVTCGTAPPLETWHHVAIAYDGSTAKHFYIDGINRATGGTVTANGILVDSGSTRLGGGASASAANWAGDMDDVRIWTRCLSDVQIKQVYSESMQGHPTTIYQAPLDLAEAAPTFSPAIAQAGATGVVPL